tara:strand:- start:519 stop:755 length:237 start_codon:yes stop_codon:yes gene_type:complete
MKWEDVLKMSAEFTDAYDQIKNLYHQYWTMAYKLPGMGEAATLDGLVVNHIKDSLVENKTLAEIVNSARPVIENYLFQ